MANPSNKRQYEVVLWGATGYTGKFTAEYITRSLPRDLKWAIAGRNRNKLAALVDHLAVLNPSRTPPETVVANLNDEELDMVAKKTQLLISTVGPFLRYGTPAFRACARNGTHYLDCTGETFWIADMIKENDATARENGAIMIPCCGLDCVPSDILTWVAVDYIRRTFSAPTARVDVCIHSIQGSVSGGTMASVIGAFEHYSFRQLYHIHAPFSLSPKRPTPRAPPPPSSIWTKLFGLLRVKELGWLGYQPQGAIDRAIVHRSWGLLAPTKEQYGENFDFHTWARLWGPVAAVFWHFTFWSSVALVLLRPVRWFLSKIWYQPGDGTVPEKIGRNWLEYRAVGVADIPASSSPSTASDVKIPGEKALVKMRFDGDSYIFTAIALAEAAQVILRGGGTQAHQIGGGVLTPATLGEQYVNRLRDVGVVIEAHTARKGKEKRKDLWGEK